MGQLHMSLIFRVWFWKFIPQIYTLPSHSVQFLVSGRKVYERVDLIIQNLEQDGKPNVCLLQLLHLICESYPSMGVRWWDDQPISFQVSCPSKMSHFLSHLGFLLLEEVESVLGSVQQKLERVSID